MSTLAIQGVTATLPEVYHMKPSRLDDSLFSKELAPHYMQLASQLAKSLMVPKAYQGKPQDLFVAMAMGYQIGLSVEQAIQAIAVINGKPCLWGDDMLGLCMAHPEFEDIEETPIQNKDGTITGYVCTISRKGQSPKMNSFTLDMAKKAGLLSKQGPWTQYPERMLKLRARGFSLRDAFPDALKGIKSREEVEDYLDVEYKTVSDKVSRTEFLKEDIRSRKENHAAINHQAEGVAVPEAIESSHTEAESDDVTSGVALSSGLPGTFEAQDLCSEAQREELFRLIEVKGFTSERVAKALQYYEVSGIHEMTQEIAADFIEQLEKL
jgi:hypothetical protein